MTIKFEGLTMNQLADRNAELITEMEQARIAIGSLGWMTLGEAITLTMSEKDKQIAELQGKLERAESAVATGLESIDNSLHVLRVETARSNQLAIENTQIKAAAILLAEESAQIYRRWNHAQQPDGDIIDAQTIHELMCEIYETPVTDDALAVMRAESPLTPDRLPVDEGFWSAVLDIIYQTESHDFTNVQLGRSDAKSLALWLSDVLPLRKEPVTHEQ